MFKAHAFSSMVDCILELWAKQTLSSWVALSVYFIMVIGKEIKLTTFLFLSFSVPFLDFIFPLAANMEAQETEYIVSLFSDISSI